MDEHLPARAGDDGRSDGTTDDEDDDLTNDDSNPSDEEVAGDDYYAGLTHRTGRARNPLLTKARRAIRHSHRVPALDRVLAEHPMNDFRDRFLTAFGPQKP